MAADGFETSTHGTDYKEMGGDVVEGVSDRQFDALGSAVGGAIGAFGGGLAGGVIGLGLGSLLGPGGAVAGYGVGTYYGRWAGGGAGVVFGETIGDVFENYLDGKYTITNQSNMDYNFSFKGVTDNGNSNSYSYTVGTVGVRYTLVDLPAGKTAINCTQVNFTGGADNNYLEGCNVKNVMSGGGGVDMLRGMGGTDELYGDAGNDTLYGGAGVDRMNGGAGTDALYGGSGGDTFIFSTTNDTANNFAKEDHASGFAAYSVHTFRDANGAIFVDYVTDVDKNVLKFSSAIDLGLGGSVSEITIKAVATDIVDDWIL